MATTRHHTDHEDGGSDEIDVTGLVGSGGAPSTADYLVGTADAGLSNEIVVGTTPGGELGGTWASPTVDATHSGSSHAGTQTAAEATAATALSGHAAAADPHTGYRLESADHSHATTGLQGGTVAHTALTSVGVNDHHNRDHAATHGPAAADPVKLDDLAAPDDNTDLNVSSSAHGLMSKLPGGGTNFFREDGTWAAPSGSGAPASVDYLVGTADGGLSNEIVVGTTPGGELGGTWAAPTVDALHSGSRHDLVYSAPGADTAINSLTNVGIINQGIAVAAGDQLIMDAWFTILNNSTATRVIVLTMEYDNLFSIEISTAALAFSSTLMHPMHMTSVLDIRSSSLAYCISTLHMQLAAGIASGGDPTVAATMLQNMGWATSVGDATGTVTVELKAKSASATATQTLRLHHLTIRRVTP